MIAQFFTKYGGCEVIAIQNLIYRKRCLSSTNIGKAIDLERQ
jgi:hypothetical protein